MINLISGLSLGILGGILSIVIDNTQESQYQRSKSFLFIILFGFVGMYLPNIF